MIQSTSSPSIRIETGLSCAMTFCVIFLCRLHSANAENPAGFLNQGTPPASSLAQDGGVHDTQIVERSPTEVPPQTRCVNDFVGLLHQKDLMVKDVDFVDRAITGLGRDLAVQQHVILDPGNLVGLDRYILEEKISVIYPGTKQHMIRNDHQVARARSTFGTLESHPPH
jgi:hypothetical protein